MPANSGRGRSKKRKTNNSSKNQISSAVSGEVSFLISLAVTVLLFLCNFRYKNDSGESVSIIGGFGDAVSGVLFGLFGFMAYIAPVIIFLAIYFGISNTGNKTALLKLSLGIVMFILLTVSDALITDATDDLSTVGQIYNSSSELRKGGGVLGTALSNGLISIIGMVGTVIVVIAIILVCLVVITEKSFVGGVKKGSQKVYKTARQDVLKRRELNEMRREVKMQQEEARRLRMANKVSGVAMDTEIPRDPLDKNNIHEITLPDEEQLDLESLDHITIKGVKEDGGVIETAAETKSKTTSGAEAKTPKTQNTSPETDISVALSAKTPAAKYVFPPLSKLKRGEGAKGDSAKTLKETALRLQQTLNTFGVKVTITDISQGPAVTRYELQPEVGVKVSKIVNLADDIKLNLAATDIRIEAPIPGKAAIGIEVPNKENSAVALRDLIESGEFREFPSNIAFAVGKDIGGQNIVADIAKMPHLLIAGATGSGKSVCINTLIVSILYKAHPEDVRMIMIDPKVVELSVYNGIPHLMIPVVTDPKKAAGALHWGVAEMTDRYKKFADLNVRDLKGYNKKVSEMVHNNGAPLPEKMPQIVIIVDELADLMIVSPSEVEESICRLAQLARAAGIHLIIATQRPSVDVITGLIKANMPSRIAFSVSSGVDSRTILDMNGAEKLLGKGDMLFYPQGLSKPTRIQGAFVSDKEVFDVVNFLKEQGGEQYSEDVEEKISNIGTGSGNGGFSQDGTAERDSYFAEAGRFIIEKDKASIGMLQRVFKIGFNRAARIMDQLSDAGVVGEEEGTKPRKILMSQAEFENLLEEL